jgi:nitronate monooxygenase
MYQDFKDLLGTELPIIQSPMAGVQGSALTIAVSQAGGLGSLPCGMLSIDQIVDEIMAIQAGTDQPYNLNFFSHQPVPYDEKRQSQWQHALQPYFNELKLESPANSSGSSRVPFSHDIADAIEAFKPPVISFHFGLPEQGLLKRVQGWGTKVVSSATTVAEAVWLEQQGVDAIIAQGVEAGGHRAMFMSDDLTTQMGLMALLPRILDRVQVPVIAAGGIGDSLGVKSVLSMGATAAQVGTAYLLCDEAKTSALHRAAIKSDQSLHTALTNVFSGKPARGIVNRAIKELGPMSDTVPDFPYASIEMTQLRGVAEQQSSDDFTPLWCGQNTLGCREVSAKVLTKALAEKIV